MSIKIYIKRFILSLVILVVIIYFLFSINLVLSKHDDLKYGIQRLMTYTGYACDRDKADLILHRSNPSDSVVMLWDYRSPDSIISYMDGICESDPRWRETYIGESETYNYIDSHFSGSDQSSLHFRPVCYINGGYYDYQFFEENEERIVGCLIDADTVTIALYLCLK